MSEDIHPAIRNHYFKFHTSNLDNGNTCQEGEGNKKGTKPMNGDAAQEQERQQGLNGDIRKPLVRVCSKSPLSPA